ncbi:MAG: 50S ribosomal protein L24 [Candidatus Eisenbacteria bacterium]|uniref:Large ribosomal subunit protein uL24 n=1 Tax=Eiseniibacteriota bacterium TaxID=2212470 RepID=A0A956RP80_UNCEI|nr:50S ribosomal protein L24 [Candidatus Eisenbacteria bacterium]
MNIRTGDRVIVIAGNDRGETGKVVWVSADSERVIVEGIRRVKRHMKNRPGVMTPGGIIEKSAPVHVSNVALVDRNDRPTRVRHERQSDGAKARVAVTTGEIIEKSKE